MAKAKKRAASRPAVKKPVAAAAPPPPPVPQPAEAEVAEPLPPSQAFDRTGQPCTTAAEWCALYGEDGRWMALFEGGNLYSPVGRAVRRLCKYRSVTDAAARNYLQFLKTGDQKFYRLANSVKMSVF